MDRSAALSVVHEPALVAISLAVAVVAAYTALLVSDRMAHVGTGFAQRAWMAAGAISMGAGIWAMHFVGMLAFNLPIAIHYDPWITATSMIPAVIASGVALQVMKRDSATWLRLNVAGMSMGAAIGIMHYVGMAAMITDAEMRYDPTLFVVSLFVAYGLATTALLVKLAFSRFRVAGASIACAVLIGVAVTGMHYTAMAAVSFFPVEGTSQLSSTSLSPDGLAWSVVLVTSFILFTACVCAVVDRRLHEIGDELRFSEELNRLIVESAGEGIVTLDGTGTIVSFNSAAGRIFGYEPTRVVGQDVEMLTLSQDAAPYGDPLRRYLADDASRTKGMRCEIEGRRSDGTPFIASLFASELSGMRDGRHLFTAVIRDLTAQRALEAQLLQAQKLESIGQLAAGIAHEINTPAQYVGDNVEFLTDGFTALVDLMKHYRSFVSTVAETDRADRVEEIRSAEAHADVDFLEVEIPRALAQSKDGIGRVSTIVRAMKEFSHPGSTDKKPINLAEAIRSTVTVATNEWKYVAEVEFDLATDLPPVPCVAGAFNQVVLNIIVNAAQALEEKGCGRNCEKGTIRIATRCRESFAEIEIADDGNGIPEEFVGRIFDPFFTTKPVGRGSGQGLSIARSVIVEKHGGTIDVKSELGVGTRFVIALPLSSRRSGDEERAS